jgi:hypothetical protein
MRKTSGKMPTVAMAEAELADSQYKAKELYTNISPGHRQVTLPVLMPRRIGVGM